MATCNREGRTYNRHNYKVRGNYRSCKNCLKQHVFASGKWTPATQEESGWANMPGLSAETVIAKAEGKDA